MRVLLIIVLLAVFFVVFVGCSARRMVFQPYRTLESNPEVLNRPVENVTFRAQDGTRLTGWYFPNTNSLYSVLLCHGNAGNISHRLELIAVLLKAGPSVFAFDYRGYGHSEGKPTERGVYQDAQAAYDWLAARGQKNIVAYGESLGGGVAAELALTNRLAGLILQSTFTSVPDVASDILPWLPAKLLLNVRFDTHQKLARINTPVLVMHSPRDTIIGFDHAQRNYSTARAPKFFCELQGDHNDPVSLNGELYLRALNEFLLSIDRHHREAF